MAKLIQCPGEISTSLEGAVLCLDELEQAIPWQVFDWATVELDPVTATQAFGAGVFIMALWWIGAGGMVLLIRFLKTL